MEPDELDVEMRRCMQCMDDCKMFEDFCSDFCEQEYYDTEDEEDDELHW